MLKGHTDFVFGVAVHPTGGAFASCGADGVIRIWELPSGRCRHVLAGHAKPAGQVAFARAGHTLASHSTDGTIKLWDAVTGACVRTIGLPGGETFPYAAFHPDGTRAAVVTGGGEIITVSLADGSVLERRKGRSVGAIAYSPRGRFLAVADGDPDAALAQRVFLRDTAGGAVAHRFLGQQIEAGFISPDERLVVTTGPDVTRVYSTETGDVVGTVPVTYVSVGFSPDGRRMFAGRSLYDTATWTEVMRLPHGVSAFTPDGHSIIAGNAEGDLLLYDGRPLK